MGEKSLADVLMDDDELEVVEELKQVDVREKAGNKSEKFYSTVLFEVGPDIRIRVVDAAIILVGALLAYLIFKNI